MPNVTLTLTGSATASTVSDSAGHYTFSSLPTGGTYTVTTSKAALTPGGTGSRINTIDIVATQRHFLQFALLSGCRLKAGDVNGDSSVNTIDVVAIQRFFLAQTTGIANTGKYLFIPSNRTYSTVVTNQTGQNYDTLIFGDVASPFVEILETSPQGEPGDGITSTEISSSVAAVALPNVAVDPALTNFSAEVVTSPIDARSNLVGFQGDLTFDSTVLNFASEPVEAAGLTSHNWNVSGNILPGTGPIRTLRISAFSLDFTPLSGTGTLFELRMNRVNKASQITQLLWAMSPDHFFFIDSDLNTQKPGYTGPGSVAPRISSGP